MSEIKPSEPNFWDQSLQDVDLNPTAAKEKFDRSFWNNALKKVNLDPDKKQVIQRSELSPRNLLSSVSGLINKFKSFLYESDEYIKAKKENTTQDAVDLMSIVFERNGYRYFIEGDRPQGVEISRMPTNTDPKYYPFERISLDCLGKKGRIEVKKIYFENQQKPEFLLNSKEALLRAHDFLKDLQSQPQNS